jgi:hypothetical protein
MALEQTISRNWMRRLVLPGLLATALCAPIALDASANDSGIHRADTQPGHVQPVQTPRKHEAGPTGCDSQCQFEIQAANSIYTRSEKAESSVQKKKDDAADGIIQNIK